MKRKKAVGLKPKQKKTEAPSEPPQEPLRGRRLVLRRALTIYDWLQEKKYPNCNTLAEALGVSPQVIDDDIEAMQLDLELPIAYDAQKFGYYFSGPVYGFPLVPLTAKEIFTLYVSSPAREQYEGTDFEPVLDSALNKLLCQLDDKQKELLESLRGEISFRTMGPEPVNMKVFETLRRAIHEHQVVEFPYLKPSDKVPEVRRVDPYHMTSYDGVWYLLTRDHGANDIRKFRLSRIGEVTMSIQKFTYPKNFDLKKVFDRCFGVMSGKGDYTVVVHMSPWATRIIGERRLHAVSRRELLEDGSSRLTFKLDCLDEIERWILWWGPESTAIEPPELRQSLYKKLMLTAGKYVDTVATTGQLTTGPLTVGPQTPGPGAQSAVSG